MILPVDADAIYPCTSCGHPRMHHSSVIGCQFVACECREFRSSPDDTVLTCVLRCLHLDAASPQAQAWIERLRLAHIPLEVPAERWTRDIVRCLVSYDVAPQQAEMVNEALASPRTRLPCLLASVNGMEKTLS